MPVDVAAHSRPRQKLHIVDSREQTGVVDLRNAGGEELDRTRQQILVVATAERVVEGAIDLVQIEVAGGGPGSFSALPGAALVNGLDQRVDGLGRQQPGARVGVSCVRADIDHADAVVCIEYRDRISGAERQPLL